MKNKLILGTLLLTFSGLICRLIGFFYRVFLARTIGAEGMGIYQLALPIYHLSYAICAAGIQTALSRLIAASVAQKEHPKAISTFITGTTLSFCLSLFISFFIRNNAVFLAEKTLNDVRCIPLLKLISFALPFGALHGCIIGWFMGRKKVHIPAGMQILEEIIRLTATYICYLFILKQGHTPDASIAIIGLLSGEVISVLFSFLAISGHKIPASSFPDKKFYFSSIKELLSNSLPLTLNRIALNLLHSVEAILIPLSLQKYSLSRTAALETLGVVTGMSLPLVLFPTAVINALSAVLLPTVSEYQALENRKNIKKLIKKTGVYACTIGAFCSLFFSILGNYMGSVFYHNQEAGHYIRILSLICPFLFVNIVFASIMNGLGKTFLCFSVNFINMCLRITCIYFLIPQIGIYGYIGGLIGGEILCTIISILIIYRLVFRNTPIDK